MILSVVLDFLKLPMKYLVLMIDIFNKIMLDLMCDIIESMKNLSMKILKWPPYNPDLNIIKTIWAIMKRRVLWKIIYYSRTDIYYSRSLEQIKFQNHWWIVFRNSQTTWWCNPEWRINTLTYLILLFERLQKFWNLKIKN